MVRRLNRDALGRERLPQLLRGQRPLELDEGHCSRLGAHPLEQPTVEQRAVPSGYWSPPDTIKPGNVRGKQQASALPYLRVARNETIQQA